MKFFRILIILSLIMGAGVGILFFLAPPIPGHSDNVQSLPLFIVSNRDPNQTHSVQVFIANTSGTNMFERTYTMNPGNRMIADFFAPENNLDLFFKVLVDGDIESEILLNMSPTHIAIIEISSPQDPHPVLFSIIDVTPKKI